MSEFFLVFISNHVRELSFLPQSPPAKIFFILRYFQLATFDILDVACLYTIIVKTDMTVRPILHFAFLQAICIIECTRTCCIYWLSQLCPDCRNGSFGCRRSACGFWYSSGNEFRRTPLVDPVCSGIVYPFCWACWWSDCHTTLPIYPVSFDNHEIGIILILV